MKKARKFLTIFALAVAFMSMCAVGDSWVPLIMSVLSWIWLAIEAYRNGWFYDPEEYTEEWDYE